MACDSEHQAPVAVTAGSGLEAVRLLRPSNTVSILGWKSKPSVVTWRHSLPRRLRRVASPEEKVETDVQLGMKMHNRVPPWMWCVDEHGFDRFLETVRQAHANGMIQNDPDPNTGLLNSFHDHPQVGPNMHVVRKYVIVPRTQSAGGMSWALMDRPQGLEISFFVTHSWKEGVYEFYRKVRYSWPAGMSMWCCFLANPQSWQPSELKKLLGEKDDLSDSPFMQALAATSIQRFLVVPNCSESLYRRLWCVAELKRAMEIEIDMGRPFIFVARDPLPLQAEARKGESVATMISEAKCSDKDDEARIRRFIQGHEQDIERMITQIAKGRRKMGRAALNIVPPASPPPVMRRHSDMGQKINRMRTSALYMPQEAKFGRRHSSSAAEPRGSKKPERPKSAGMGTWMKQKVVGLWSPRANLSQAQQAEMDKHDAARLRSKKSKHKETSNVKEDEQGSEASDLESINEEDDFLERIAAQAPPAEPGAAAAAFSAITSEADNILFECDLLNI